MCRYRNTSEPLWFRGVFVIMPLLIAGDGSVGAGFITFYLMYWVNPARRLSIFSGLSKKVVHFFRAQHISKTMLDEVFEYFPAVLIRSP